VTNEPGINLQKLGVFAFMDAMTGPETLAFARKIELLGYSVLWFPELDGRDALTHAICLLSTTKHLAIATGVANVFKRPPAAMAAAANTIGELFPRRFILGLGVSHRETNARRGLSDDKPYTHMRGYLASMGSALYTAPAPTVKPPIVLGALLPRMVALANSDADGVLSFLSTREHTAEVRETLRADKWICVTQAVILENDEAKARAAAREFLRHFVSRANYRTHLSRLGFDQFDFDGGPSDRLVDSIVALGDKERLRDRIAAHISAGADHVCILPLRSDPNERPRYWLPDERCLEALAPIVRPVSEATHAATT